MMKAIFILSVLLLPSTILFSNGITLTVDTLIWKKINTKEYSLYYSASEEASVKKPDAYLQTGIAYITGFFHQSFQDTFSVYIFPDRSSLDKQWQKDWGDTTFRSECWMIASGVAHRLDMLSSNAWTKEACDHNANDSTEVRQVIWHELVHVFHGQNNPDHTFSYIEKLDWLVEGLATFVSGQLDDIRKQRVKQMVSGNKTPSTLDD